MAKRVDVPALIVATVAVIFAGFRVARIEKNSRFDEMIEYLRAHPPMIRCDPRAAGLVIGRLLRWITPRRMGSCMKRSLILLHLWSGEGIEARLHLGVISGSAEQAKGHAWLSVNDSSLEKYCGNSQGRSETYDG